MSRLTLLLAVICLCCVTSLVAASALNGEEATEHPLAIHGYDPVAYFTIGEPRLGKPQFETLYRGISWQFHP